MRDKSRDLICEHCRHDTEHGYICVPMMAQGEIIGLLYLEMNDHENRQSLTLLAETLSAQIATALSNISLREALQLQNIRDPLTNLYNRRYLEETMEREQLLARRSNSSFGVMMIDIDHFKHFNDTQGHQAGDELLSAFADYLRRNIRGEDIACRYGGEEFIIIMPGADSDKTMERAEQLRLGLHELHVQMRGQDLPTVTGSFGVAVFPLHGNSWQEIIHLADIALYRAKKSGRDQVMAAET